MRRVFLGVMGLWCLSLLFMPVHASADLGASDVQLMGGSNCYVPGETTTICFLVTNDSPDTEGIKIVGLTFPTGWTLAFHSQETMGVLDVHNIINYYVEFSC